MDAFWDAILSIGNGASDTSGASYMLQQNFRGGYTPIGERYTAQWENAPLAPLMPLGDDYDQAERAAIQWESEQPPDPDPTGTAGVQGFDGLPDLTAEQHGAILHRLMNPAQEAPALAKITTDATQPASEQPAPSMAPQSALRHSGPMIPVLEKDRHGETIVRGFRLATQQPVRPSAPATITCSSCAEFEPGLEPEGLGRCSRTADGLPPIASRGYGVCFPHAPRTCPDHKEP